MVDVTRIELATGCLQGILASIGMYALNYLLILFSCFRQEIWNIPRKILCSFLFWALQLLDTARHFHS